jgi:hypothetical protein
MLSKKTGWSIVWLILAGVTGVFAGEHRFRDEELKWWAVQPIAEVEVPEKGHAVDYLIQRKLADQGLKLAEKAGANELVRRVYFDLHGLPPTDEEVRDFEKAFHEDEEAALRGLIDELLKSPRYGERWVQHWLDVVRYAESDGYRADDFRPNAYQYRDYVIRSFNEDKRYDQFVMEQLAADEMGIDDPAVLVATGFLRHGVYEWNQRDAEMQRKIMMDEITGVTGEVFMGLGIGCAQCHDHKFDPILQEDYFKLQAFLATTWFPDDHKYATAVELKKYEEDQKRWDEATFGIRSEMEKLVREGQRKIREFRVNSFPPKVQEMFRKPADKRTAYEEQIADLVRRQVEREVKTRGKPEQILKKGSDGRQRYEELKLELAHFDHLKPVALEAAFVSRDVKPVAAQITMGEGQKARGIEPGFLAIFDERAPRIESQKNSTGRRLALAKWLVKEDNPLTARVMVNRIWQHHFGKGLVATPNDFGMLGDPPSHPELLDFLSRKFIREGWSMKKMHRYLMMSQVYRQTARYEPSAIENRVDPGNRLLWKFPPRRLSSDQLRDAMLSISGELREKMGGPSEGDDAMVRSIYLRKKRNTPNPVLQCFDAPQGFVSDPDRLDTTTPTQSLLLSNSEWTVARARALAGRILQGKEFAGRDEIHQAFQAVWGRKVEEGLIDETVAFLEQQRVSRKPDGPPTGEDQRRILGDLPKVDQRFLPPEARVSLRLEPGSRYERLALPRVTLQQDHFAVSGVVQLDGIREDARVNILASKWSHHQGEPGWTLGVTSQKSRYGARNLIVQLVGRNPGGDLEYEVVASGIRFPLGRPVLVKAEILAQPEGRGTVKFFLQDLSQEGLAIRKEVSHNIAGDLQNAEVPIVLGGGARSKAHGWLGSFAWVRFVEGEDSGHPPLRWTDHEVVFSNDKEKPTAGGQWLVEEDEDRWSEDREAFVDFCHTLLMSNEFLYLH